MSIETEPFFASLIALLGSPMLLALIVLAIPIGMFFGAVPGLGESSASRF